MIRVLIVDDSALVRKILSDELSKHDDIEVVGTAIDPYIAREKIVRLRPDVITLDVEMPRMDGLSFLSKLMRHFPLPVIVVSSLTPRNSETAIRALSLGAVDVLAKPGSSFATQGIAQELARAVRVAAQARVTRRAATPPSGQPAVPAPNGATRTSGAPALHLGARGAAGSTLVDDAPVGPLLETTHKILAIGASTGGTQAIEHLLKALPANVPGTVIVQHMPEHFTAAFAQRLNGICPMEVREAKDGDAVIPGVALIAPGGKHMVLHRSGANYVARIKDGPPVHHQRPAVDVLFQSVARHAGKNAVGVLLTGMGADGAKGMLAMKEAGAYTLAQDERSCVVFGMPREAIRMDAHCEIAALQDMARQTLRAFARQERGELAHA